MTKVKIEGCAHDSFAYELVNVAGINHKIAVLRCSDCGQAIGTFVPEVPDAINRLAQGINALYEEVKKIPH